MDDLLLMLKNNNDLSKVINNLNKLFNYENSIESIKISLIEQKI